MGEFCVILIANTTCQVQFTLFLDHYAIFFHFSLLFVYISGENGSNVGERNIGRSFNVFFETYTAQGEIMFYINANFQV
jgi:hypothetical protein